MPLVADGARVNVARAPMIARRPSGQAYPLLNVLASCPFIMHIGAWWRSARHELGSRGCACLYVGFLVVSIHRLGYRLASLSLANQLGGGGVTTLWRGQLIE